MPLLLTWGSGLDLRLPHPLFQSPLLAWDPHLPSGAQFCSESHLDPSLRLRTQLWTSWTEGYKFMLQWMPALLKGETVTLWWAYVGDIWGIGHVCPIVKDVSLGIPTHTYK